MRQNSPVPGSLPARYVDDPAAAFPALRQRALAPGGRPYGLLAAAVVGALTLVDPHRMGAAERRGLARTEAAASGAFVAAEAASSLRLAGLPGRVGPAAGGLAAGAATAALALSTVPLNDRIDGALVRFLERAGASAPRAVLAGAAALAVLAGNESVRRERRNALEEAAWPAWDDLSEEEQSEPTAPLPVEVRVLLETLLDPALAEGRELPGAAALRAQLPHVRTVASMAEAIRDEDEVPDWTPLVVETDGPVDRAVPHDHVWPVRGRFAVGEDGHEVELRLQVIDGELGALVITLPADEDADPDAWDAFQELEAFPGVDDLTFQVDGERRD